MRIPITIIARSKPMRKAVEWSKKPYLDKNGNTKHNLDKVKKHLPPIIGVWIASFYVLNTLKSKDIPKERKTPFVLNFIINDIIGVTGGYALASSIFKFTDAIVHRFETLNSDNKNLKTLKKGLKSIVPLVAFTFTLRYLGPVLATPLADKATNLLASLNLIKDSNLSKPKTYKS